VVVALFIALLVAASTVALAGCGGDAGSDSGAHDDVLEANARVVRVVDGDTVVIRLGGVDEHMRLIGIDTPETVDPRRPVECFGKEASDHTKELLPKDTRVRVERDAEARDRYDRLLGYVYRASDGLFVNLAMVADGYAKVLTYPPNVAHTGDFTAAQADARTRNAGLWGACPAEASG
jgi:micrococcal nuclease